MKNFTSMNNHCIIKAFVFLLLCSGCGNTDEPAINIKLTIEIKPAIDSEDKAIEAIKALGGEFSLDLSGNVDAAYFCHTKVTDAELVHLKGLTSLTELNLRDTKISDAGMGHLGRLTSLTTLYLENTEISDAGLDHLYGLKSLRNLNIRGTKATKEGMERLQAVLPNCKIWF